MLFGVMYTQILIRNRSDVMDMQGGDVSKIDGRFAFGIILFGQVDAVEIGGDLEGCE